MTPHVSVLIARIVHAEAKRLSDRAARLERVSAGLARTLELQRSNWERLSSVPLESDLPTSGQPQRKRSAKKSHVRKSS